MLWLQMFFADLDVFHVAAGSHARGCHVHAAEQQTDRTPAENHLQIQRGDLPTEDERSGIRSSVTVNNPLWKSDKKRISRARRLDGEPLVKEIGVALPPNSARSLQSKCGTSETKTASLPSVWLTVGKARRPLWHSEHRWSAFRCRGGPFWTPYLVARPE